MTKRVRAFTGQTSGSLLHEWETCSPWTAFFWSENVKEADSTSAMSNSSFKGAERAE